jgi:hypothetical protein
LTSVSNPQLLALIREPDVEAFKLRHVSKYLDDLVSQIDALLVEDVDITCNEAERVFHSGHIVISLVPSMRIFLPSFLGWNSDAEGRLTSLFHGTNIRCLSLLSRIERLGIQGYIDLLESTLQVDMDDTQLLGLFYPFPVVQTLSIFHEFRSLIASDLQGLDVSEVLPGLDDLHLERNQVFQVLSGSNLKTSGHS